MHQNKYVEKVTQKGTEKGARSARLCSILVAIFHPKHCKNQFHKITSYLKRVNVLRLYVLPSRMRVREGSPKKTVIENRRKKSKQLCKNSSKKREVEMKKIYRKFTDQVMKNLEDLGAP